MMKTKQEKLKQQLPSVRIDTVLNKYDKMLLFPDKVAKAKEAFERLGVPDITKHQ